MHDLSGHTGRLHIALLTHSMNPRGGVVHTIELAHALHDAGHTVTVIAPALPDQRFFRPLRCAVEPVPVTHTPKNLRELVGSRIDACVAHLAAWPGRESIDVWHAHDGIGGNALATLTKRGLIDGFVRTVHHLDTFDDPQVMAWQERAWRKARRVLCVSRGWCELFACLHGVAADEVRNGVDAVRFSPQAGTDDAAVAQRLGLRGAAPRVLLVGGVEERKNSVRLLHAFAEWRREQPAVQLVIAGGASLLNHDPYARRFHLALRQYGLRSAAFGDVVLTGSVPDADMPALFRSADVLAMPSLREGFGLVVLEALASGTPVVTSKLAPFTEYLDESLVDWADPMDCASIADALRRAFARGRSAQRSAAVQALLDRYNWAAGAQRHLALYREMLAAPARTHREPADA